MGEPDKVFNDVEVYGITATQGLIIALLTSRAMLEEFFKKYITLSRENIAKFLELRLVDVEQAFNDRLADTLWDECVLNLRNSRSVVDAALISAAMIPNGYGNSDRKLYYELIGATGKRGAPETKRNLSREEKLELISKNLSRIVEHNIRKDLFNGRRKRKGRVGGGPVGEEGQESESAPGPSDDEPS